MYELYFIESGLSLVTGDALSEVLVALSLLVLRGVAGDPPLTHGPVAPDVGVGEAPVLLEYNPDGQQQDSESATRKGDEE